MNKTLLLVFLMVSVVSSFSLTNLLPTFNSDPITTICTAVGGNANFGNTILNQMKNVFSQSTVSQRLPVSTAYVANTNNQQQFLAGGNSCGLFFGGLQNAFQTDLQNNGQVVTNIKQNFIQFLKDQIALVKTLLG